MGEAADIAEKAIEFSKMLQCENPQKAPCGLCNSCRRIEHRGYTDVFEIFPEGASIKIDQVRRYVLSCARGSREGEYKIYIFHQAHKMTPQAQNALLKTLEEPIAKTITVLLTENLRQLLPTVVSRCQTIDFTSRAPSSSVKAELRQPLAQLLMKFDEKEPLPVRTRVARLMETGENPEDIMEFGLSLYRDVLVAKTRGKTPLQNPDLEREIFEVAKASSEASAMMALDLIYSQRKAAQSRGNQNLLWYNLVTGLREVTQADNSSRSSL